MNASAGASITLLNYQSPAPRYARRSARKRIQSMQQELLSEHSYRFAAFAARGKITLRRDSVRIETRTHLGWWKQELPLSELRPTYGTLTTTTQLYIWTSIISALLIWVGAYGLIWGLHDVARILLCLSLTIAGAILGWYVFRNRRSDWIIFNAFDDGGRVAYTRQGPDSNECDSFTTMLQNAILTARSEQNKVLVRSRE